MKQAIIGILVVVGIIAGATMLSNKNEPATTASQSNNISGKVDAKVTLTEYGDFQCPACGAFEPIVAQVKEEFKDQLKFEFKHFPLVQIHPNATAAHRAAQAAANQGKFWEMHDAIYANQQSWSNASGVQSIFEQYARSLELDMDKYLSDANSSETLAVINADVTGGKALGISSTPTFLINGKIIEDPTSINTIEGFRSVIQQAVDSNNPASNDTKDPTLE